MQSWILMCKWYKKHGGKTDTQIVSYIAKGMFKPRPVAWYQTDQTRIDALSLYAYLTELSQLVLKKNWSHDILETILSSSQGNQVFIDWKIELENLNAILTTSTPTKALTKAKLKTQLQSNLHPDLRLNISLEPVLAVDLAPWAIEVKEHDDQMQAEDARTQKLIDASTAACATHRSEKKDLLSQLTDPPVKGSTSTTSPSKTKQTEKKHLLALTLEERALLDKHASCTWCHKFNAGHKNTDCPMKTENTWPNAENYMTLMVLVMWSRVVWMNNQTNKP